MSRPTVSVICWGEGGDREVLFCSLCPSVRESVVVRFFSPFTPRFFSNRTHSKIHHIIHHERPKRNHHLHPTRAQALQSRLRLLRKFVCLGAGFACSERFRLSSWRLPDEPLWLFVSWASIALIFSGPWGLDELPTSILRRSKLPRHNCSLKLIFCNFVPPIFHREATPPETAAPNAGTR